MKIHEKYSLSIYHFNLQYVAGNVKTYHHLHKSSMRVFLRFFDRHPEWNVSCEIQGHYIAFMAKFYPKDLALLRKLNQRDQIEIVSVHYSDQIYLAYPKRDLIESIKINDEILKHHGLIRSKVWFGQENFFGQGIAEEIMKENGFETALLNSHFVWHHDHDGLRKAPYWKFHGNDNGSINYLHSKGQFYEDEEIHMEQIFSYWDDAELAFGATPYASWIARPRKQYIAHYKKYKKLQEEGYKIVKVMDYIKRVKELNLKPDQGQFLTDATWNTRYYGGTYLWMGYYRLGWERDARLRTLTFQARTDLLATESLMKWAKTQVTPLEVNWRELNRQLKLAWKHLLLAEVSDSTGQQPAPIEVKYTESECGDMWRYLGKIQSVLKRKYNIPRLPIDTSTNEFCQTGTKGNEKIIYGKKGIDQKIKVLDKWFKKSGRKISFINTKLNKTSYTLTKSLDKYGQEDRHYILDFKFSTKYTPIFLRIMAFFRDGEKKPDFTKLFDTKLGNYAGISFPLIENKMIYSPSCQEHKIIDFPAAQFDFEKTWLPLPNGLIGLGDDVYVIKHNTYGKTHIACTLNFAPEFPRADFLVLNPYLGANFEWRYSLFKGTKEEALDIANTLNVFPLKRFNFKK